MLTTLWLFRFSSLSVCIAYQWTDFQTKCTACLYIPYTQNATHFNRPKQARFSCFACVLIRSVVRTKKKIFLIRKYVFEYESNRRERDDTMWPTSMLLLRWIWKSNIFDGKIRFLLLFRLRILFRLFKKFCFFFQLNKFSTRFWSEIAIFLISFFKRFVLLVNTHKNVDVLSTAAF